MSHDEEKSGPPRVWASRDRSKGLPPKRIFARHMRRMPTDAERKLWSALPAVMRSAHFRRQALIGGFIVDFVSHKTKLIIEVDGGQHSVQMEQDAARTERLNAHGFRVLRSWNNDVLDNLDRVLEDIQNAITATPTPDPTPQGGGESQRHASE